MNLSFAPNCVFFNPGNIECQALLEKKCKGACEQKEPSKKYNARVTECIDYLEKELPSFALVDAGLEEERTKLYFDRKRKILWNGLFACRFRRNAN